TCEQTGQGTFPLVPYLRQKILLTFAFYTSYTVYNHIHSITPLTRRFYSIKQNWKHVLLLAKFELNVSKMNVLFTMVFFLFVSTGLKSSYGTYLDKGFVLVDLLYLVMFTAGALWTKPKELQVQRIHNELLAQLTFIMQNQLPVPTDALIKSRFIIYFVYSFPWQLLLLLTSYLFAPELKTMMTPGQFIAFSIIWLSFGI